MSSNGQPGTLRWMWSTDSIQPSTFVSVGSLFFNLPCCDSSHIQSRGFTTTVGVWPETGTCYINEEVGFVRVWMPFILDDFQFLLMWFVRFCYSLFEFSSAPGDSGLSDMVLIAFPLSWEPGTGLLRGLSADIHCSPLQAIVPTVTAYLESLTWIPDDECIL